VALNRCDYGRAISLFQRRTPLKNLLVFASFALVTAPAALFVVNSTAMAQGFDPVNSLHSTHPDPSSLLRIDLSALSSGTGGASPTKFEDAALVLPSAPEPASSLSSSAMPIAEGSGEPSAEPVAGIDHYDVMPSATWHQIPFSRIGIGADISPLGIGIKSAIVLNHYFDGRLMGNFFSLDTGRFEIDGVNVDA
jgi:hypothetical protein